jgi:hypothetical protein
MSAFGVPDKLEEFQDFASSVFTPPWELRKYRDYFGQRPCIYPPRLANIVERVLLRVRVLRDDREEAGE